MKQKVHIRANDEFGSALVKITIVDKKVQLISWHISLYKLRLLICLFGFWAEKYSLMILRSRPSSRGP